MNDYQKLVNQALQNVSEIFPWDLAEKIKNTQELILLDIREPDEFALMYIEGSISVPRGVLEGACCWGYDDTVPALAVERNQDIVVICRSGNRSVLAAQSMMQMGFVHVCSLKMGIKGWNDNDMPMLDLKKNVVDIDKADDLLNQAVELNKQQPSK
jgi:rhodanese-related sulfurtransferase